MKQKHGADAGNSSAAQANNRTNIICKHFLDAVEKRQYGWFWQCPNGNKECKYRRVVFFFPSFSSFFLQPSSSPSKETKKLTLFPSLSPLSLFSPSFLPPPKKKKRNAGTPCPPGTSSSRR